MRRFDSNWEERFDVAKSEVHIKCLSSLQEVLILREGRWFDIAKSEVHIKCLSSLQEVLILRGEVIWYSQIRSPHKMPKFSTRNFDSKGGIDIAISEVHTKCLSSPEEVLILRGGRWFDIVKSKVHTKFLSSPEEVLILRGGGVIWYSQIWSPHKMPKFSRRSSDSKGGGDLIKPYLKSTQNA